MRNYNLKNLLLNTTNYGRVYGTLKKKEEEVQSQNKRPTALITEQSGSLKEKDGARDDKIQKLESLILGFKADNDIMKAIEDKRRGRVEERRKVREAELKAAENAAETQKSRGFFSKLFGGDK